MYTEYFGPIDREKLSDANHHLEAAARKLQQGGLVAFPTETTYGLGAIILNVPAIERLFAAKGRPADRSLPVQVANIEQVKFVAKDLPSEVFALAKRFLPGPLTLVLKKHPNLCSKVTAGKETVAIRIPSDPIALRLIELTGCPLAVPSANQSGKPSPTTAAHVLEDLNGLIEGIVDGGETELGIETTILSLEDPMKPTILRVGAISQKEIEEALGRQVTIHPAALLLDRNSCFPKLRSTVRLFASWDEMKIYLKLSAPSKRLIMSEEPAPIEGGDHFKLSAKSFYEGLRTANRDGYVEVLVLCDPQLKRNAFLLNRLKQIAST
ncbi:L-threonylcarbamoyladenylate synthase [Candidatus Neptunochlamydia vexilliferae]|uniref:Threonylcarbamoyl-AMP synthase n=1 Tax=Candidatus Neptunichlamydia vexilliferae TaxID=1651774 RepID=A0ABS0AXI6_9BACT|nr:L-threonylcarbamoyladenylate synthase [Candidatus Neptunochlamydia vexilliferae]MBF5058850.1 Threonylcarbamoyl-AMP synthase [Candidatus Neptunochlamydia vexilliferae]